MRWPRRVALVLLIAAASSTNARAQEVLPRHGEDRTVAPQTNDVIERVAYLDRLPERLDSIRARSGPLYSVYRTVQQRFARLGVAGPGCLLPSGTVANLGATAEPVWPDNTHTRFVVDYDLGLYLLYVEERPGGCLTSADIIYQYYFENGWVVMFRRSASVLGGCGGLAAREVSTHYYDAERRRVIAKTYAITNSRGREVDASACDGFLREPYAVGRDWNSIQLLRLFGLTEPLGQGR